MAETLTGTCLCEGVEYEVRDPKALGYCHCTRCQRCTGSSLAGVVVAKENFKVTKGEDLVTTYTERVSAAQLLQRLRVQLVRRPRRGVLRGRRLNARPRPRAELPPAGRIQGPVAPDRRRRASVRRDAAGLTPSSSTFELARVIERRPCAERVPNVAASGLDRIGLGPDAVPSRVDSPGGRWKAPPGTLRERLKLFFFRRVLFNVWRVAERLSIRLSTEVPVHAPVTPSARRWTPS